MLCAAGCKMCPTPHDFRITGFVDRDDDYRGFYPDYRAGSIFSGEDFGQFHLVGDVYNNAGNFGTTTPVKIQRREPNPGMFGTGAPWQPVRVPNPLESVPFEQDGGWDETPTERRNVPSIEELLDRQYRIPSDGPSEKPGLLIPSAPSKEIWPTPLPTLKLPNGSPQGIFPSAPVPDEAIPFSPSDEAIIPPNIFPTILETESPITLEELRRLDPTVQEIEIISIEDVSG